MKYLQFLVFIFVGQICFGQIQSQILFNENANRLPIIPGMSLWFDAADAGSIVKDANNKVSLWQDKSPNANHAYQSEAINQPVYNLNQQNGMACVIFPSTVAAMSSFDDGVSGTPGKGKGTYQTIIAVRNIVNSDLGISYQNLFSSGANEDFSLRLNGNYSLVVNGKYTGDGNGNDWTNGNTGSIYVNGVQTAVVPPRPNYHIVVAATSAANKRVNRRYSLSSTFMNRGLVGGIAELIVYDRELSNSERQSIEAYLARKWKISITPALLIP